MLLWTALHASTTGAFMSAVPRYHRFKSSNQSFAVTRKHFDLLILNNLATMRTRSLLIAEAPPPMI